jgi:hypothetical protein
MTLDELKRTKAPFVVVSVHDGSEATVTGFQYDPHGVGVRCAYFAGGGWCMFEDLLKHWTLKQIPSVNNDSH